MKKIWFIIRILLILGITILLFKDTLERQDATEKISNIIGWIFISIAIYFLPQIWEMLDEVGMGINRGNGSTGSSTRCDDCAGTGWLPPGKDDYRCPSCGGTGEKKD